MGEPGWQKCGLEYFARANAASQLTQLQPFTIEFNGGLHVRRGCVGYDLQIHSCDHSHQSPLLHEQEYPTPRSLTKVEHDDIVGSIASCRSQSENEGQR